MIPYCSCFYRFWRGWGGGGRELVDDWSDCIGLKSYHTRKQETYFQCGKSRKNQCFYKLEENITNSTISLILLTVTCVVFLFVVVVVLGRGYFLFPLFIIIFYEGA